MSSLPAALHGAEWLVVVVPARVPVQIVLGTVPLVLGVARRPRD